MVQRETTNGSAHPKIDLGLLHYAVFVYHLVKWGGCPPLGLLHISNTDNVLRPFQI